MKSLRTRLLLLILPLILALLTALGCVNYLLTSDLVVRSTQESLLNIARARESALLDYIEASEKIGTAIAATDIVQTWIELTNRDLSGRNQETLDQLGRRVENLLYSFQQTHWGRLQHLFLVNRSNRIVISPGYGMRDKGTPSKLLGRDLSDDAFAMGALQRGVTMLSRHVGDPESGQAHQVLYVPVRDASNRVQAVVGIELPLAYQQQILTDGFQLGRTGAIFLATDKGIPLTQKGIDPRARLSGDTLAETRLEGLWTGRRINARDREVLGVYVKQNRNPWILAVEIDAGEAFADWQRLQQILIGGLLATLVALTLLLLRFGAGLARPLQEVIARVKQLGHGEFNLDIPDSTRKDEIGQLNRALQRLSLNLQQVSRKLLEARALKTRLLKSGILKKTQQPGSRKSA